MSDITISVNEYKDLIKLKALVDVLHSEVMKSCLKADHKYTNLSVEDICWLFGWKDYSEHLERIKDE